MYLCTSTSIISIYLQTYRSFQISFGGSVKLRGWFWLQKNALRLRSFADGHVAVCPGTFAVSRGGGLDLMRLPDPPPSQNKSSLPTIIVQCIALKFQGCNGWCKFSFFKCDASATWEKVIQFMFKLLIVYIDVHYYLRKMFKLRDTCFNNRTEEDHGKFGGKLGGLPMVLHRCPFGECTFLDEDHPRDLVCFEWQALLLKLSELLYLHTISLYFFGIRDVYHDVHGWISIFGSSEEISFLELTS